MQVDILTRQEASEINAEEWDSLAEFSENTNPFYERWCLLPALKFLDKEKEVYLVVIRENNRLTGLFPIQIERHPLGIRYLTIWQHSQCFLCDPLCLNRGVLHEVFHMIMVKFNTSIFKLPLHSRLSFGEEIDKECITFSSSRGSVSDFSQISQHFEKLPRKIRLENKRIVNKLFQITGSNYVTSDMQPERNWLYEYTQLENSGWKGRTGGSILSSPDVQGFYEDICSSVDGLKQIEFQGLFNKTESLAISMRIYSGNKGFDLKTSYNELFKEFYPGVVLEINNLKVLFNSKLELLDSCTSPNNPVINRLWPKRQNINLSFYFDQGLVGRTLHVIYKLKNMKYLKDA